MTTTMTTTVPPMLTTHDGCDCCCAPAKVRALLRTGGELLFCWHHARAHGAGLRDIGAVLILRP
jgi:hypothetical protein